MIRKPVTDPLLLDVTAVARLLGCSPKSIRARVARRLIPFRRLGGRIVFLRTELVAFIEGLDGCDPDEAHSNLTQRRGR